jgi:GntR family carbon starvation induced transcriptional regulator
LRLSIAKGDTEWESKVVAASYLMRKQDIALAQITSGVPDSWEDANTAFHSAMVTACGSKWLLKVRASLHDQCARYRRASVYQKLGQRDLDAEHQAISEAVLSREVDLACELTAQHFALTATSLSDAASLEPPHR